MSKRKGKGRRSRPSRKRKTHNREWTSLVIPAIVGVVVVVIIVGAIISIESSRPATASMADNVSFPLATVQPKPTFAAPFPDVPRVSLQDAQAGQAAGKALMVDVRTGDAYNTAHIAGAISVPEAEIDARLDALPRDKELIFYCT